MGVIASLLRNLLSVGFVLRIRVIVAKWRDRHDVVRRRKHARERRAMLDSARYYEALDLSQVKPKILSLDETMRRIIDERLSVSRFGDGEFLLAAGRDMAFQHFDDLMRRRVLEILSCPIRNWLCCFPNTFGALNAYTIDEQKYWRRCMYWVRREVLPLVSGQYEEFGDAFISRAYLRMKDKSVATRVYEQWKELFRGKNILIVEGRYTRLGVGNDLLAGAAAIRRIWCPHVDAFKRYDEIKAAVLNEAKSEDLILLALGGTATILAYDLAKEGLWAVDVGHLDVEYIWMKMGVEKRTPIPYRFVVECHAAGSLTDEIPGEHEKNNVVMEIKQS